MKAIELKTRTFSFVCPLKVMMQASLDKQPNFVFLRSQSFSVLSVDAEITVSPSKNFT